MSYHPLIGITIFVLSVLISFVLGRMYFKKKLNILTYTQNKRKHIMPKGDITSPDAPWLDNK